MNDEFNNFGNSFNPDEPAEEKVQQEPVPHEEEPIEHIPTEQVYSGDDFSKFEKYNDDTAEKAEPQEPPYSPYANQQYSSNYEQPKTYSQPNFNSFEVKEEPKKKNKGLKGFIIALVAVILCVAIIIVGYPKLSKKNDASTNTNSDSTQLQLNDTPAASKKTSSGDVLSSQEIAEKSKVFNVGILLYGSSQGFSFYSSSSDSLVGEGSGIVMGQDKSGKYTYIITCAHVISGVESSKYTMRVQDCDGNTYDGIMVGYDTKTDVGVIKIEAKGLKAAEFGDSSKLSIGETVYAIGNPGGTEFFGSFTNGIVSSIDRPVSSESGYEMKCIQHTAPINSGNSGGALLNQYGQVIGINSSKIVSTGYEGMGFAVPITDAQTIINDIISHGYVTNRAKLGISYAAASSYQQYAMVVKLKDLPAGSLIIASISKDSSLQKTDVQVGDMITAVNGEKLDDADVLLDKIENGSVGDTLKLTICRISNDYSISTFTVNAKLIEDTGAATADEEQTTTQNYFEQFFGSGF